MLMFIRKISPFIAKNAISVFVPKRIFSNKRKALRKEDERMNNNTCCGCVYENIDDTTENISKCVCCKRNVEYAKNDYYMRKEDEGK